ncbi:S8 family peptidase [Metabacillus halosaccharovorans]|uniref:S8 family peptidase n=1 Tax=Metabacillus halosaccharovorans TaxID=930124 RepID=A0ABT3DCI4_9BACI|nr:S8 family peptidase [Metabacillus halosaccharovorans]MCV9884759.1 S8 family peptidase [Metabacillus halosaccharovorans]
MRYLLFLTCLIFLIGPLYVEYTEAAESDEQEYLILFKDSINKDLIKNVGGRIIHEFSALPAISVSLQKTIIPILAEDPSIEAITQKKETQISKQTIDWGHNKVNSSDIHQSGFTGKGYKIAILDSGVNQAHPDLKISGGKSFVDYTSSYEDDNGHGTHVAGIINAQNNDFGTLGIAYEADVYILKVFNNEGVGDSLDLAHALDWAITNNMDIINLSIGFEENDFIIKSLIQEAYANNMIIVAAAGNNGYGINTVNYPARYNEAIAVGSVNKNSLRSSYSSTGSALEVVAPGEDIYSSYLLNGYGYMSGTSMAAPYAAGYLALLWEANPTMTNSEIRKLLRKYVTDLGIEGFDNEYGYGLINSFVNIEKEQEVEEEVKFTSTDKYFEVFEPSAIYIKENNELVRVGRLSPSQVFPRIRDYGSNWHEVKYGNKTAYVNKEFTRPTNGNSIQNLDTTTPHSQYVIKPKQNIAVYDNSSGELVNFGAIYTGVSFPIISDYGNWYKIKFIDRIGFIRKKDVVLSSTQDTGFFKVISPTAIYQKSNNQLIRVGRVSENQVYPKIRDYGPNWYEIQFGNSVGYINKDHTVPGAIIKPKNLNNNRYSDSKIHIKPKLNIAVYDNTSGSLVQYGAIYTGRSYPTISDYGNWYRVKLADRIGYIRKKDVNIATP